ncbi:MAG: ATP-binding protein [Myxococcales bacterium]|nr:ATP-binding protein [Myxococcales bacterium]
MKERILDCIADGILVLSDTSTIQYANVAMCRTLEADPETLVGAAFGDFLSETELLALLGIEDTIRGGQPTWLQVVFKSAKGQYVPLSVTLSVMVNEEGNRQGYVMVCRSQTEIRDLLTEASRLAAEEVERRVELQHAKEAAERREQLQMEVGHAEKLESIGQLAAGIAHEINTPIQFVGDNVAFLQRAFTMLTPVLQAAKAVSQSAPELSEDLAATLKRSLRKAKIDYLHEEVPRAIDQTLDGVARVAKIVRAMKEVSHPSSQERQDVDLNRSIENTLTVARNEWKYVATVETQLAEDMPMVPCYPDEINQVILNIVVNAAHAVSDVVGGETGTMGKITIVTAHDEDHATLRIQDTGTGIPAEIVQRIFDPFFTTKEVGKGTGQGLALSYHVVVRRHGGSIDVETLPGQGSTFIVKLPLKPVARLSDPDGEQGLVPERRAG